MINLDTSNLFKIKINLVAYHTLNTLIATKTRQNNTDLFLSRIAPRRLASDWRC